MKNIYIKFQEKNWFFDFVYLFGFLIIFSSIFLILIYYIEDKPLFENDDLELLNIKKIIPFILIIPLIEEFGTRGVFSLKNKTHIILFGISSITLLLTFISNNVFKTITVSTIIIFCVLIIFNYKYRSNINYFINSNYVYILIISSVIFGCLHFFNYKHIDFFTILKIILKILGGLYLGYITFKYGIIYSYLMHAINNLIPIIILFIYTNFFKLS